MPTKKEYLAALQANVYSRLIPHFFSQIRLENAWFMDAVFGADENDLKDNMVFLNAHKQEDGTLSLEEQKDLIPVVNDDYFDEHSELIDNTDYALELHQEFSSSDICTLSNHEDAWQYRGVDLNIHANRNGLEGVADIMAELAALEDARSIAGTKLPQIQKQVASQVIAMNEAVGTAIVSIYSASQKAESLHPVEDTPNAGSSIGQAIAFIQEELQPLENLSVNDCVKAQNWFAGAKLDAFLADLYREVNEKVCTVMSQDIQSANDKLAALPDALVALTFERMESFKVILNDLTADLQMENQPEYQD